MSKPTLITKAKCGLVSTNVDLCQILSRLKPVKKWSRSVLKKALARGNADWYWVLWQHISVEKTRVITLDNGYRHREKFWALIEWRPVMSSLQEHWSVVNGGRRGPVEDGGNGEIALQVPSDFYQNEYMTLAALDAAALSTFQQLWPGDAASDSSEDFSEDDPNGWAAKWLPHFYGLEEQYTFQVKYVMEAVKVGNPYGILEIAEEVSDTVRTSRDDTQNGTNPFLFVQLDF